jgi:LytS/YehU family sensor histidine kinase
MKPYLTLKDEIESVQRYLEQESVQQDGKLNMEFYLDPEVDTSTIIPRKLLQVFVENALRNGVTQENSEGTIDISINKSNLGILIMVADSGFRFTNGSQVDHHQSEGLKILSSYLPAFSRQHQVSIDYDILNLTQENGSPGARVLITIKN